MSTIETALKEKNKNLVLKLIEEGFLIGPQQVTTLLEITKEDQRPETQTKRVTLQSAKENLINRKKIPLAELESLPPNHVSNPSGAIQHLETTFTDLLQTLA